MSRSPSVTRKFFTDRSPGVYGRRSRPLWRPRRTNASLLVSPRIPPFRPQRVQVFEVALVLPPDVGHPEALHRVVPDHLLVEVIHGFHAIEELLEGPAFEPVDALADQFGERSPVCRQHGG